MTLRTRLWPLDLLAAVAVVLGVAWLGVDRRGTTESIVGLGRAIDGDSLVVDGVEIRLYGIDAPEYAQTCEAQGRTWPCGQAAGRRLAALIAGREVSCKVEDKDRYGRFVCRCEAGGADVAAELVGEGLAVAEGAYYLDEARARAQGRGIWAGRFVHPAEWRRAHPR